MSGRDLEAFVKARLAAHPSIRNISALARAAGIQRDTLHRWFAGPTVPDPDTLARVATALGVPMTSLWEAYMGGPEPELRRASRDSLADWQQGYDAGFQAGFAAGRAAQASDGERGP